MNRTPAFFGLVLLFVTSPLTVLANDQEGQKDAPSVQHILHQAGQLIDSRDVYALTALGQLYERAGNQSEALEQFDKAKSVVETADLKGWSMDSGGRPSWLSPLKTRDLVGIASAQFRSGHRDAGLLTLEQASRDLNSRESDWKKVEGLLLIAETQLLAGKKEGADRNTREALRIASDLNDSYAEAEILRKVAEGQAARTDREGALHRIEQAIQKSSGIKEPARQAGMLSRIAASQVWMGDESAAEKTLRRCFEVSDRIDRSPFRHPESVQDLRTASKVGALLAVAKSYAESRKYQKARDTIREAVHMAKTVATDPHKSAILQNIAIANAKVGDVKQAFQAEESITDTDYTGVALPEIAEAQILLGDFDGAQATAKTIAENDRLRSDDVLSRITMVYVEKGDLESALRTVRQVDYYLFRLEPLKAIARTAVKAGQTSDAVTWASSQKLRPEKIYALFGVADGLLELRHSVGP